MHEAGLDKLYSEHLSALARRTDAALAATAFDALVIHAGAPPMLFLDDQAYPYKVNPHFKAWVPIVDNPGCILIYVPGRAPASAVSSCRGLLAQTARACRGSAGRSRSRSRRLRIPPSRVPCTGPVSAGSPSLARAGRFPTHAAGSLNDPELLKKLHYDRAVKTPYELECMRRANALGARGHRAALAAFLEGASEYTTQMRYLEACEQREEEMPYNNIVAYNENAAVLHYQKLERRPPESLRSLLIDAGAQFRGYAADITRTYAAASGFFSDLIAALDSAQLRYVR